MQLLADRLVLSPSDLNDYVECEHLTTLAREVAWGKRSRPHVANQYGELLGRKGEEHEAAYLAHLRGEGRQVVDVRPADVWDFEAGARATVEAMRAGVEIIYQATFVHGDWRGRADFLERVERVTSLGAWGYEAVDALWLYKTNGNTLGGGQNVPTGPAFIDKSNIAAVSQFAANGTR